MLFSENGEQMLSCITDVLAHMQNSIIKLEKVEFWWLGAMSITWASSVPAVNNEKKISLFTMNKQHSERRKWTLKQHTSTRVHKYTHARTYIVTSNLNSICKKRTTTNHYSTIVWNRFSMCCLEYESWLSWYSLVFYLLYLLIRFEFQRKTNSCRKVR